MLGEQTHPYFAAGAPVHVLGFAESPGDAAWNAVVPTTAFAGRLAKAYVPGEDVLLSGPMARTVHARGTRMVVNLLARICAVNAFAVWREAKDEHGCLLYVLVNDGTCRTDYPPCLTDRIKAGPPADAPVLGRYERQIANAAAAQLSRSAKFVEKSLAWSR